MLYYYLLYFFIAVGAKLVLAMVMIYLLLPDDRRCAECDGETLLIRPGPAGRFAARLAMDRIQTRWCPRCGSGALARRTKAKRTPIGVAVRRIRTTPR